MPTERTTPGIVTDADAEKLRKAIAKQLAERTAGSAIPEDSWLHSNARVELDRLLTALRKKGRFSEQTIAAVAQNPGVVEDFHATQILIFHGANPMTAMTGFWERHPVVDANRQTFSYLSPAFDFIAGRFRQTANERNVNRYQRALRGH